MAGQADICCNTLKADGLLKTGQRSQRDLILTV